MQILSLLWTQQEIGLYLVNIKVFPKIISATPLGKHIFLPLNISWCSKGLIYTVYIQNIQYTTSTLWRSESLYLSTNIYVIQLGHGSLFMQKEYISFFLLSHFSFQFRLIWIKTVTVELNWCLPQHRQWVYAVIAAWCCFSRKLILSSMPPLSVTLARL